MSKIDRYKLETTFHTGSVTHTTYKTDLATGQRKTPVQTTWTDQGTLGSGGFGVVALQRADVSGQLRAVKKIMKGLGHIDYSRELKVLSKAANHEDLFVRFLGWYESADFVFMVMEYIAYGDLSQYMKSNCPVSPSNAREITRQLLEGLALLHEMQICHRDLKPHNVLIASPHPIWVKIADFGVSKSSKGTELRTRIGSQGYFAPELMGLLPRRNMTNAYTDAVDIWALGCIVHEVLTAEIPFLEAKNSNTVFSGLTNNDELVSPQTDLAVFKAYCDGTIEFPIESLTRCNVGNNAIEFVKSVLVADPGMRMAAKESLRSAWLKQQIEPGTRNNPVPHQIEPPESSTRLSSVPPVIATPRRPHSALVVPTPPSPSSTIRVWTGRGENRGSEGDAKRNEPESRGPPAPEIRMLLGTDYRAASPREDPRNSWGARSPHVGESSGTRGNSHPAAGRRPSTPGNNDFSYTPDILPSHTFHTRTAPSTAQLIPEMARVDMWLRRAMAGLVQEMTSLAPENWSWVMLAIALSRTVPRRIPVEGKVNKASIHRVRGYSTRWSGDKNQIITENIRSWFEQLFNDDDIRNTMAIDMPSFHAFLLGADEETGDYETKKKLIHLGLLRYPNGDPPHVKDPTPAVLPQTEGAEEIDEGFVWRPH